MCCIIDQDRRPDLESRNGPASTKRPPFLPSVEKKPLRFLRRIKVFASPSDGPLSQRAPSNAGLIRQQRDEK